MKFFKLFYLTHLRSFSHMNKNIIKKNFKTIIHGTYFFYSMAVTTWWNTVKKERIGQFGYFIQLWRHVLKN